MAKTKTVNALPGGREQLCYTDAGRAPRPTSKPPVTREMRVGRIALALKRLQHAQREAGMATAAFGIVVPADKRGLTMYGCPAKEAYILVQRAAGKFIESTPSGADAPELTPGQDLADQLETATGGFLRLNEDENGIALVSWAAAVSGRGAFQPTAHNEELVALGARVSSVRPEKLFLVPVSRPGSAGHAVYGRGEIDASFVSPAQGRARGVSPTRLKELGAWSSQETFLSNFLGPRFELAQAKLRGGAYVVVATFASGSRTAEIRFPPVALELTTTVRPKNLSGVTLSVLPTYLVSLASRRRYLGRRLPQLSARENPMSWSKYSELFPYDNVRGQFGARSIQPVNRRNPAHLPASHYATSALSGLALTNGKRTAASLKALRAEYREQYGDDWFKNPVAKAAYVTACKIDGVGVHAEGKPRKSSKSKAKPAAKSAKPRKAAKKPRKAAAASKRKMSAAEKKARSAVNKGLHARSARKTKSYTHAQGYIPVNDGSRSQSRMREDVFVKAMMSLLDENPGMEVEEAAAILMNEVPSGPRQLSARERAARPRGVKLQTWQDYQKAFGAEASARYQADKKQARANGRRRVRSRSRR